MKIQRTEKHNREDAIQKNFKKNIFVTLKQKLKQTTTKTSPSQKLCTEPSGCLQLLLGRSLVQLPHLPILPSESTTQLVKNYPEQSHEQILQGSHSKKLAVTQGCI